MRKSARWPNYTKVALCTSTRRSRLAGDGDLKDAIAGKPAPTKVDRPGREDQT